MTTIHYPHACVCPSVVAHCRRQENPINFSTIRHHCACCTINQQISNISARNSVSAHFKQLKIPQYYCIFCSACPWFLHHTHSTGNYCKLSVGKGLSSHNNSSVAILHYSYTGVCDILPWQKSKCFANLFLVSDIYHHQSFHYQILFSNLCPSTTTANNVTANTL